MITKILLAVLLVGNIVFGALWYNAANSKSAAPPAPPQLSNKPTESVVKTENTRTIEHHNRAKGLDVSHFQGTINWDEVKRSGFDFVYIKATGGITYRDPRFHINWHGARQAGMLKGAYHFFYARDEPLAQANNFLETVGSLSKSGLPPALDFEILDGVSSKTAVRRALIWLQQVERRTGIRPILYTNYSLARTIRNEKGLSRYALWIAEYESSEVELPQIWKGKNWTFWQYSEKGKTQGIQSHIDLDIFNGTKEELRQFIKLNSFH